MDANEEIENVSDGVTSKINAAGLINLTTNNLWVDFYNDFRKGKYLSANNDLDCIWTILGGEKGVEKSPEEEAYNEIEKELKETGSLSNGISTKGFEDINPKFILRQSRQKRTLLKKALFLRRLQNEQGKGTAYEKGESDYMDE